MNFVYKLRLGVNLHDKVMLMYRPRHMRCAGRTWTQRFLIYFFKLSFISSYKVLDLIFVYQNHPITGVVKFFFCNSSIQNKFSNHSLQFLTLFTNKSTLIEVFMHSMWTFRINEDVFECCNKTCEPGFRRHHHLH